MKDESRENYKQVLELLRRYCDMTESARETARDLSVEVEALKSLIIEHRIASPVELQNMIAASRARFDAVLAQREKDDLEKREKESHETLLRLLERYEGAEQ